MTAQEARQKALWNMLPSDIRHSIMLRVDAGDLSTADVTYDDLSKRKHGMTVEEILNKLGYKVTIYGNFGTIKW